MTRLIGVVATQGKPTGSAVVELHNSSGDVVDQVVVDERGRYTFHLSPGDWTLAAWDHEGRRGSAAVTVTQDRDEKADIDLSR